MVEQQNYNSMRDGIEASLPGICGLAKRYNNAISNAHGYNDISEGKVGDDAVSRMAKRTLGPTTSDEIKKLRAGVNGSLTALETTADQVSHLEAIVEKPTNCDKLAETAIEYIGMMLEYLNGAGEVYSVNDNEIRERAIIFGAGALVTSQEVLERGGNDLNYDIQLDAYLVQAHVYRAWGDARRIKRVQKEVEKIETAVAEHIEPEAADKIKEIGQLIESMTNPK